MTRNIIRTALLALAPMMAGATEVPRPPQMIDLSCMEALVATGRQELAGVFSFVSEKDGPAAFADLIVHNKKAMTKFIAKVQKDLKVASGISAWDRDALQFAIAIYESPLGATLKPLGEVELAQLRLLAGSPILSLEQISSARRR